MNRKKFFTVKGEPFFSIGIQAHNSDNSTPGFLKYTCHSAKMLEANTVAVPVPWELYEKEEGSFDNELVRNLIDECRRSDLKLVILWFGTWKNGTMEYVPAWVKRDTARFQRVLLKDGHPTLNLSPFCPATFEADARAFRSMMAFVRDHDAEENTVIGVQIQNEAGIHSGTRRDFSSYGNEAFEAPVPEVLFEYCGKHPESLLARVWQKNGAKKGNWTKSFGASGGEWISAYGVADFINRMAAEGRKEYDTFYYTNAWLNSGRGIAGVDWPAGTPRPSNLDIYYAVCSDLDTIAPDLYLPDPGLYREFLEPYYAARDEFTVYIPESGRTNLSARMMMETVGTYGAVGHHVFGGESLLTDDQKELTKDEGECMMHSFHMLRQLQPILCDYVGTDRIHTLVRQSVEPDQLIEELDGPYRAYVSFTGTLDKYYRMDFRHKEYCREETAEVFGEPQRGLLIQESEKVFYIVGQNFRVFFYPKDDPDGSLNTAYAVGKTFGSNAEFISVTEGHFDENGEYVPDVWRTGDEVRHGVFALWDNNVIRVEML